MTTTSVTPQQILKRALWLAFRASSAVGYGFLHSTSAAQQTEDSLYEACGGGDSVSTDYAFGRMMKTSFSIKDGEVVVSPENPRSDYQSWAFTYPTGSAIVEAAKASLKE